MVKIVIDLRLSPIGRRIHFQKEASYIPYSSETSLVIGSGCEPWVHRDHVKRRH